MSSSDEFTPATAPRSSMARRKDDLQTAMDELTEKLSRLNKKKGPGRVVRESRKFGRLLAKLPQDKAERWKVLAAAIERVWRLPTKARGRHVKTASGALSIQAKKRFEAICIATGWDLTCDFRTYKSAAFDHHLKERSLPGLDHELLEAGLIYKHPYAGGQRNAFLPAILPADREGTITDAVNAVKTKMRLSSVAIPPREALDERNEIWRDASKNDDAKSQSDPHAKDVGERADPHAKDVEVARSPTPWAWGHKSLNLSPTKIDKEEEDRAQSAQSPASENAVANDGQESNIVHLNPPSPAAPIEAPQPVAGASPTEPVDLLGDPLSEVVVQKSQVKYRKTKTDNWSVLRLNWLQGQTGELSSDDELLAFAAYQLREFVEDGAIRKDGQPMSAYGFIRKSLKVWDDEHLSEFAQWLVNHRARSKAVAARDQYRKLLAENPNDYAFPESEDTPHHTGRNLMAAEIRIEDARERLDYWQNGTEYARSLHSAGELEELRAVIDRIEARDAARG